MDEQTRVLRTGPGTGVSPTDTDLAADPLIGRRLEGRYELVAPLARGGMATVYRALDTRLDREVAVKIMHAAFAHDPDFVQRFEREAKAVARVSHPNVVAVYDTGLDSSANVPIVFLVMELIDGRNLRDLLDERGHLTPSQALQVLEPLLSALVAAHNAGLVHRDIKPENVLLANSGAVKVADFGLARAVEASSLTANSGLVLGTMAYLAPEQVTQGSADGRTDVYAAGIVLYEMLTGTVPFSAATPMAVAYQHVHGDVPAPSVVVPELPPSLDALVLRATAKEPDDRYETSAAFLVAARQAALALPTSAVSPRTTMALPLSEHLTEALPVGGKVTRSPVPPTPSAPAETKRKRRRPRKWVVIFVVLAIISAAAGAAGWWYGSGRYVHVPQVVGLAPDTATRTISSHDLKAVNGDAVYSDSVGTGLIASTSPGQGSRLTHGDTVVLHPSLGIRMVSVPVVANLTEDAARSAIEKADLKVGNVAHANSTSVRVGSVISSDPAAGQPAKHGSAVTLTISDGPAPVQLPNLVNTPEQQATTTLTQLGLVVQRSDDFSSTVAAGSVISQNPGPGTVHQGDKVALVISKGPQMVQVPNVMGKTAAAAMAKLAEAGLQGQLVFDGGKVVVYQSPAQGQSVAIGSTIRLYTA